MSSQHAFLFRRHKGRVGFPDPFPFGEGHAVLEKFVYKSLGYRPTGFVLTPINTMFLVPNNDANSYKSF